MKKPHLRNLYRLRGEDSLLNSNGLHGVISRKTEIQLFFVGVLFLEDRLCGLVVRVPGCRSRGPGSFPALPGLDQGPLSLVTTTEELLERKKSSGSCLQNLEYGRGDPLR
jgi:hypothetical protein